MAGAGTVLPFGFFARRCAIAVAAGGSVIFTSRKGKSYVFKAGPRPELVSTNALPGSCISTPAIADEKLYIRTIRPGGTTLWCIGNR